MARFCKLKLSFFGFLNKIIKAAPLGGVSVGGASSTKIELLYSNHARGVYIIKPQIWISPTQRVVYHHCERGYSLRLMIYKGGLPPLMIYSLFARYTRKKRMIYQVCDLDKKITASFDAVIFWWKQLDSHSVQRFRQEALSR